MSSKKRTFETNAKDLNQYFTNSKLAGDVFGLVESIFDPTGSKLYIEPAAGDGAFFYLMPSNRRIGVDIDAELKSQHPEYIIADFTLQSRESLTSKPAKDVIVLGNPPFTKRTVVSKASAIKNRLTGGCTNMSLKFINHAATMSDTVCFLVGCNMKKLSIQEKINPELHLVHEKIINSQLWKKNEKIAFTLGVGSKKIDHINIVFQVWQRKYDDAGNMILRKSHFLNVPKLKAGKWHDGDFEIMEATSEHSNIAIRCQGSLELIGDVIVDATKLTNLRLESAKKKKGRNSGTFLFLRTENFDHVKEKLISLKQKICDYCKYTNMGWSVSFNMMDLLKIYTEN